MWTYSGVRTVKRLNPILRVVSLPVLTVIALALLSTPAADGQGGQNISVALIIDNSGSMASTDPTGLRFAAASQLVDLLEEGDEISVILFADDSATLVSLTGVTDAASKEVIKAGLGPLAPAGNTNMRAGLEAALTELEKGSNLIRFGIFLTDGELQPPGWLDLSEQDQEAERLAVFSLADSFGERGWGLFPISLASAVEPEFLQQLAEKSGGVYRQAPAAAELTLAFQEVFAANKLDVFEVLLSDCLAPGEQVSVTFPIHEFVSTLSLFVTYTSDLRPAVTLAGPDEELVSPSGGDARYDAYSIDDPARGSWSVSIAGAAEGESCLSISSTPRTLVDVVWLQPSPSLSLLPGEPLEIAVRLTAGDPQLEDGRPVEDALVTVTVTGPSGQSYEAVLQPTGSGEYAGTVVIDGVEGSYSINLVAETEDGLVAQRSFQASVSLTAIVPSPPEGPAPSPGPGLARSEGDGLPLTLLFISLGPLLLVGLSAVAFLAFSHFGRPVLSGWLMSPGELISVEVGRSYDLEARHRRIWTRRALTIGGPKDDIDLGLDKRAALIVPRRDGECFLQAVSEGDVMVDGSLVEEGQRRRLYHGSELNLGGVPLVYRR